MTKARIRSGDVLSPEYEIVQFTGGAEWVLRDPHNDVRMFEESSSREAVEVRCDFCGRWVDHAAPVAPWWVPWMGVGTRPTTQTLQSLGDA